MRLRTLNRLLGLLTLLLGLTQTALAQSFTVFDAPHAVQTHSQGDSISGNWQLIATLPGENSTYIGTTIARSNNSLTWRVPHSESQHAELLSPGRQCHSCAESRFHWNRKQKHDRVTISSV